MPGYMVWSLRRVDPSARDHRRQSVLETVVRKATGRTGTGGIRSHSRYKRNSRHDPLVLPGGSGLLPPRGVFAARLRRERVVCPVLGVGRAAARSGPLAEPRGRSRRHVRRRGRPDAIQARLVAAGPAGVSREARRVSSTLCQAVPGSTGDGFLPGVPVITPSMEVSRGSYGVTVTMNP